MIFILVKKKGITMEQDTKKALALILSEIYELKNQIATLQNREQIHDDFTIEALKSGNEHIINQELGITEELFWLTENDYNRILNTFDQLEKNNSELINTITGFYDLPREIQNQFNRNEWLQAFKTMKHHHVFDNIVLIIEGSQNSPLEFSSFG